MQVHAITWANPVIERDWQDEVILREGETAFVLNADNLVSSDDAAFSFWGRSGYVDVYGPSASVLFRAARLRPTEHQHPERLAEQAAHDDVARRVAAALPDDIRAQIAAWHKIRGRQVTFFLRDRGDELPWWAWTDEEEWAENYASMRRHADYQSIRDRIANTRAAGHNPGE